jgi:hypothetical protein
VDFDVPCTETVVVLVLMDVEHVGGDGCLDDLKVKGAGSHCFEDCVSKERGWGEHAEPIVIDISTGGGSEGTKGVGADGCCGNDVSRGLSAFRLGGNSAVNIKNNDLGIAANPKKSCYFVGGLEGCPPVVFQIVENDNLFLVVCNEDEVVVLAQVFHLGVYGSVVCHCFQEFHHVAVADCVQRL